MEFKTVLAFGCLALFMILDDEITAANKVVPKLYEEIGCKKINESNSVTTRFECPDFATYSNDKCYLKGKTFNVGDNVEGDIVPSCKASCRCSQQNNETAEIICANVECPENFGDRDWSCVSQYDNVHHCCRSGEICDEARISQMNKCEVDGKSYRIGERFNPDNTYYQCLCDKGYNSTIAFAENPNCVKIDCGIELDLSEIKAGCVPIYYKTPTSCPIEYKCPSKDDAIETPTADEKSTCKFGELTLKADEKLKSTDKCLTCQCSTPPYVTCIRSNDC